MPSSINPPSTSTVRDNSKPFSWVAFRNLALVYLSLVAGIVLLFQNPQFAMYFEPDNVGWYVKYSQTIFHPDHSARTLYWGESILLPLLGKLLGASKTLASFKVFCCAIALSLLPTLAYFSLKTFKYYWQAVLMVVIFAITFVWLREIGIGYPDPLTALLFIIAAFAPHPLIFGHSPCLSSPVAFFNGHGWGDHLSSDALVFTNSEFSGAKENGAKCSFGSWLWAATSANLVLEI